MSAAVHLYDRHDPQADPDRSALNRRVANARAWAQERHVTVLAEHVAAPNNASTLTGVVTTCVLDGVALLMWDTAAALPDADVLGWCVRSLQGLPLLDAAAGRQWRQHGDQILPLPTRWPATAQVHDTETSAP